MIRGNSFLKGAFILGVAGIIVKILGAFFRIPLANIIGDDGMGYYQSAYPIYLLLVVISTAGFPTAIAKLVSEKVAMGDNYAAHRIFKVAFSVLFIIGIITSSILFFGAGFYSKVIIKNPKAYYSTLAIAPALFFVPIMSAFRGYFQGLQNMKPTAISQIIEQMGRVVLGLGLAFILLNKKLEIAAAGATFGATAGSFFGAIMMTYIYFKYKKSEKIKYTALEKRETTSEIIRNLLTIAIPITIGAAVMPVMQSIDAAIVMRRLQDIGYNASQANGLYGQLTGMANPLINLPQVLTAALQISLVPAVSHLIARKDTKSLFSTIEAGMRISLLIGLPSAVGLVILSKPIMMLLYPRQIDSAINASAILAILGYGIIFLSLFQILTGILQGFGKPFVPVKNLFTGAVVKLILSYILLGISFLNIRGAAIATVIGYAVAAILNFAYIIKMGIKFNFINVILKPIISVVLMAVVVKFSYSILSSILGNNIATLIAVVLGVVVYGLMLLITKTITEEDLQILPGGSKLQKIFKIFNRV
ncbi:stage V sporulation protein B [Caminicella sporogenes DSM 14501]|uniref:Stage V sporulation protein B n=1 Tax=Caminicella sporogenes DSM 14501 TaxID=1121266 RepID=A0A1M6QTP9_9FIRM|nr:polysaccharide biosynthesis protein [Caminicella sporogenes]RKD20917.1 stage V sporulation protein B [Caminicella sporogenes]SHK23490.1 stage V sporulation protein B [Caminicella sporogenes DSM 14501]